MKVNVVPIITGEIETVPKRLTKKKKMARFEIQGRLETIRKIVILKLTRMRMLYFEDLLSLALN